MELRYIVYIVFISIVIAACSSNATQTSSELRDFPVIRVEPRDTVISKTYVANIEAAKNVRVHARISGLIKAVLVSEGQHVQKGQPLFKINDDVLRVELEKTNAAYHAAEAAVKMAQVELSQIKALFDKKIVAKSELDIAQAKYESALAQKNLAKAEQHAIQQKINFTTITAPFNGVIDRIPFKEGSLVNEGDLLTTISDLSHVYAYFSIPEDEYFELLGNNESIFAQRIQLQLPNGEVYRYKGELHKAESEIDRITGSIAFKAKFSNPDGLIKHGTSGKLLLSKTQEKAILVPHKSVFSIQDKNYVFLVSQDNNVKMHHVVLGATLDGVYIVDAGLNGNELIVYEGIQTLREGDVIKPKAYSF